MIEFDASRRCDHVNYIDKNDATLEPGRDPRTVDPNHAAEGEYLFAPYSVFTLASVKWSSDLNKPHEFTLLPATDNKKEDENLPLAPWY